MKHDFGVKKTKLFSKHKTRIALVINMSQIQTHSVIHPNQLNVLCINGWISMYRLPASTR